jgi:flagellar biosynthesis protein FlhF
MRLKTYTAASAEAAIAQIRRELGDDALVVSTEAHGDLVRVVAAVESGPDTPEPAFEPAPVEEIEEIARREQPAFGAARPGPPDTDPIDRVLAYHNVPPMLRRRVTDGPAMGRRAGSPSVSAALAKRLAVLYRFAPLARRSNEAPLVVVGPPASGKTLVVAKIAAQATLDGRAVRLVTCDRNSAGGVPALAAFAGILDVPFDVAETPDDLARFARGRRGSELLIVDTAAANPFVESEIAAAARLVAAARGEALLALPAGLDPIESVEVAEAFSKSGATTLVPTRMDCARRMGGLLAAAAAGTYAFAEASFSPSPADSLEALDAERFARILVASAEAIRREAQTEAVS